MHEGHPHSVKAVTLSVMYLLEQRTEGNKLLHLYFASWCRVWGVAGTLQVCQVCWLAVKGISWGSCWGSKQKAGKTALQVPREAGLRPAGKGAPRSISSMAGSPVG